MNKNVASTVHKNANGANNWIKFMNALPPPTSNLNNAVVQVGSLMRTSIVAAGRVQLAVYLPMVFCVSEAGKKRYRSCGDRL